MKREQENHHDPTAEAVGESRTTERVEKRILVVDDDSSVREMLSRVLAGEGYGVLAAANGAEALEIAAAKKIDLVLLDLNMPGQSGWDTFERLTASQPLLAVIIITARPNQLFTALGAGVGALLEKPLDFPQLLQAGGVPSGPRGSRPKPAPPPTRMFCSPFRRMSRRLIL